MNFSIDRAWIILQGKVGSWVEVAVRELPNIIMASFVLIVFFSLSRIARSLSVKLFCRFSNNVDVCNLLSRLTGMLVFFFGIFISLDIMHLNKTVTSLLAGAGVIGIVLGFAFQEISANFLSGLIIAFRKPFERGDIVEAKGHLGEVERIDLGSTTLKTFEGLDVIVPNKYMLTEPVINLTHTKDRRIQLNIGVSYGEDLDHVRAVLEKVLEDCSDLLQHRPKEVYASDFGDSSINFMVRAWVAFPGREDFFRLPDCLVRDIKRAFDREGITIPFPIRTLDFGIKGGQSLKEQMKA